MSEKPHESLNADPIKLNKRAIALRNTATLISSDAAYKAYSDYMKSMKALYHNTPRLESVCFFKEGSSTLKDMNVGQYPTSYFDELQGGDETVNRSVLVTFKPSTGAMFFDITIKKLSLEFFKGEQKSTYVFLRDKVQRTASKIVLQDIDGNKSLGVLMNCEIKTPHVSGGMRYDLDDYTHLKVTCDVQFKNKFSVTTSISYWVDMVRNRDLYDIIIFVYQQESAGDEKSTVTDIIYDPDETVIYK